MKINALAIAGLAAVAAVSCSQVRETTVINGTVENLAVESVTVKVVSETAPLDTSVAVVDGKFSIELPTNLMTYGQIYADSQRLPFIPDGTELEVVIADSSYINSNSSDSVNDAFYKYSEEFNDMQRSAQETLNGIYADTSLGETERFEKIDACYEEISEEFKEFHQDALEANKDNFLGLQALSNFYYELDNDELQTLLESLSDEMKAHPFVAGLAEALKAKQATAEGQMFTDFEVQTVVGHDRSMDANPIYATARLSDYVGKGKYVLVDFWSPWCGPCKREMPNIKAIYEKWHGDKFDVLSIAVWEREDVKVTMETADKLGVTWNQINNAKDIPTKIYGIEGIPHIILFGPDGTILKRGLHGEELAKTVEEYLSK